MRWTWTLWPSIEAVATVVPEGENEMAQRGAAWARKWEITSAVRRSRTTTVRRPSSRGPSSSTLRACAAAPTLWRCPLAPGSRTQRPENRHGEVRGPFFPFFNPLSPQSRLTYLILAGDRRGSGRKGNTKDVFV